MRPFVIAPNKSNDVKTKSMSNNNELQVQDDCLK